MSTNALAISLPVPSRPVRRGSVKQANKARPPVEVAEAVEPVNPAEPMEELDRAPDRSSDNGSSDNGDDLHKIKGISLVRAAALNNLGIRRYADLAAFTPDSLAELMKAEMPSISAKLIARGKWIGQARTLAQPASGEQILPQAEREEPQPSPEEKKKKWKEHASFSVFFDYAKDERGDRIWQTRVYDDKSGIEEPLPGIATAAWVNWILERAHLPAGVQPLTSQPKAVPPPPEAVLPLSEAVPPSAPVPPHAAEVEILDVDIIPPLSGPAAEVTAQIGFQVAGPQAEMLTSQQLAFRVELYTVDLESGASKLVATEENQLQPQVYQYSSQPAFPTPKLGRHELHALVLLLPPGDIMASYRGSIINVVP